MKDAEEWRTYAVNLLMSKWTEQFHPDGYTQEMSGAYHWVALRNFFAFYQVAQHNGMEQIFPSVYTEWLSNGRHGGILPAETGFFSADYQ